MGSISIRRSVQWLPDDAAPSEPTSTIVLTSPGRRFVDIRIFLPVVGSGDGDGGGVAAVAAAAAVGVGKGYELASAHRHFGTITAGNLDWAFCGTSESSSVPTGPPSSSDGSKTTTTTATTHSKWHHLVSDRARDVTGITDEGDMCPHPSGDGSVLETGRMVNSATGRDTAYEEVWVDGAPGLGIPGWGHQGGGEGGAGEGETGEKKKKKKCVVLEARDRDGDGDDGVICGMVVCLGRFCQGVVRRGERFGLERWSCRDEGAPPLLPSSGADGDDDGGGGGGWKQRARLDTPGLWIPARQVIERAGSLNVGDVVVAGRGEDGGGDGVTWTVVEAC